jgi:hypothetical protein
LRAAACDREGGSAISEMAGARELHVLAEPDSKAGVENVARGCRVHSLDLGRWEVVGLTVTDQNAALITQLHDNRARASTLQLAADTSGRRACSTALQAAPREASPSTG